MVIIRSPKKIYCDRNTLHQNSLNVKKNKNKMYIKLDEFFHNNVSTTIVEKNYGNLLRQKHGKQKKT